MPGLLRGTWKGPFSPIGLSTLLQSRAEHNEAVDRATWRGAIPESTFCFRTSSRKRFGDTSSTVTRTAGCVQANVSMAVGNTT